MTVHAYEIVNGDLRGRHGYYTVHSTECTLRFAGIDTRHQWRLTISLISGASSVITATGTGGQSLDWLTANHARTVDFNHEQAPELTISGLVTGSKIHLHLAPVTPVTGAGRLAVVAYTPRPEWRSAWLGSAILGAFRLPDPRRTEQWSTLGQMRLGRAILASESDSHAWHSILDPATAVDITRGIDYSGYTGRAEVGTLTVTIRDQLDPRASGLFKGTPIMAVDNLTRLPLFTGTVTSTTSKPAKGGGHTLTVVAHDLIGQISQVRKWQDTRNGGAAWDTVLTALVEHFPHEITATTTPKATIAPIAREATLTEYVDMVCATSGANWWISPRGILTVTDHMPTGAAIELVVTGAPARVDGAYYVHDANATVDTTAIMSTVEATNHFAQRDEGGEWQDSTTTLVVRNPTNAASYGENTATVDTAADNLENLRAILDRAVATREAKQIITSATLISHSRHHPANDAMLTALVTLDVLDPVRVTYRNETQDATVTRISHKITPLTWETTLDLTQWRK